MKMLHELTRPLAVVVSAFAILSHPAAASDGPTLLTPDRWRADLDEMVLAIEEHHFQPYRRISREDFHAAADALRAAVPDRDDVEILLGMAELVALLGDGHTRLALPRVDPMLAIELHGGHGGTSPTELDALRLPRLPVELALCDDGLFVTRATAGLERLLGAEVIAFDGTPTEEAVAASERLAYADNELTARWFAPDRLALPHALAYLGLAPAPGRAPITVVRADGEREDVVLAPATPGTTWTGPERTTGPPLFERRPDEKRWYEVLADDRALYVQIDELEPSPDVLTTD